MKKMVQMNDATEHRQWFGRAFHASLLGLLMMSISACHPSTPDSKSEIGLSAAAAVDKTPNPSAEDTETIGISEFLAAFKEHQRPQTCEISSDFTKAVDPSLRHFHRVAVIMEDGSTAQIKLQDFGAWAIWKNAAGNYEMLSTIVNNIGVLMHLHTLSPQFQSLGNFEVARRTYIMGEDCVKRGSFAAGDNYAYTVVTDKKGQRIDSLNGLVIVAASGNYKVMDEIR
jgi:hypothetical protein